MRIPAYFKRSGVGARRPLADSAVCRAFFAAAGILFRLPYAIKASAGTSRKGLGCLNPMPSNRGYFPKPPIKLMVEARMTAPKRNDSKA